MDQTDFIVIFQTKVFPLRNRPPDEVVPWFGRRYTELLRTTEAESR